MKLFLKDQLPIIILYCLTFIGLFLIYDWLGEMNNKKGYFIFLSLVLLFLFLLYQYFSHKNLYNQLSTKPEKLEDAIIPKPHCAMEEAYSELMYSYLKLHHYEMNRLTKRQREYQVMINNWVHQIKTPVSVISMLTQMNEGDPNFSKIKREVNKINYDLSQILTYLRTEDFSADLKIEKTSLRDLILEVTNDLKDFFISKSVFPNVSVNENLFVYTDEKWMKIILFQVINNAIKYSDEGERVHITVDMEGETTILKIMNKGIGIEQSDLNRVFDLFFTGENGRRNGESTGMGLYIVKKILDMLNHEYKIESTVNEKTTFSIYFKP
ncbi:sensor histidine kinase [Viridibacillus arvi]|uniref:sensor histidine kinase n=1 Tax=Viridibacillus arvi TaxID=263475 RepID=UPI003D00C8BF